MITKATTTDLLAIIAVNGGVKVGRVGGRLLSIGD